LSGWDAAQAERRIFSEVFQLVDDAGGAMPGIPDGTCEAGRIWRLRHREGQERWVRVGGSGLHDQGGRHTGRVIVLHDVSDQLRLQEMLRQSQKMDAMGQLAGGVAHDFNNMLAGILGFAELLVDRLPADSEDQTLAQRIVRTAERASGLTRQLLAFSRKGRLVSRSLDLHRVVDDSVALLRRTIDPRVEIIVHSYASDTVVVGDPSMLENAIINLGLNARDAMPKGGKLVLVTGNQRLEAGDPLLAGFGIAAGNYLELSVRDTGCGMTASVLAQIFTPFFTTKEPGKGTGLGLAAVYGIVRDHRGALLVESNPGRGTNFRILLPVAEDRRVQDTGIFRRVTPEGAGMGCVLVVDDEESVRQMAAIALRKQGFEVLDASDGAAALDLFALHFQRIDLVVLDLVMPRLHGRDVFVRLRQIDPYVPILLTSGYTQDTNLDELLAQSPADFISKPYRISALGERVMALISG
jgi:signal transduction histidine kinase/CheY-like chemotaxis protein